MKHNWMKVAVLAMLAVVGVAQAQELDVVKKGMLERKPAVEQLLVAKSVGENSSGFLEAIAKLPAADAKTVALENADRQVVYTAIAARNGADVAKVGKLRAAEIAAKAKPGTLIQAGDGKWVEKK